MSYKSLCYFYSGLFGPYQGSFQTLLQSFTYPKHADSYMAAHYFQGNTEMNAAVPEENIVETGADIVEEETAVQNNYETPYGIDESGYISSDSSVYDIDSDDENYNTLIDSSEDQQLDNSWEK